MTIPWNSTWPIDHIEKGDEKFKTCTSFNASRHDPKYTYAHLSCIAPASSFALEGKVFFFFFLFLKLNFESEISFYEDREREPVDEFFIGTIADEETVPFSANFFYKNFFPNLRESLSLYPFRSKQCQLSNSTTLKVKLTKNPFNDS